MTSEERLREEWVTKAEAMLQSILFMGYTTKQTDAGMLFRMMCSDARKLRECLQTLHDDLKSKPVLSAPRKMA